MPSVSRVSPTVILIQYITFKDANNLSMLVNDSCQLEICKWQFDNWQFVNDIWQFVNDNLSMFVNDNLSICHLQTCLF